MAMLPCADTHSLPLPLAVPDDLSSPSAVREQMRSVYDTNVFGVAAMVTAFLPSLHQAKQNNPQRRPAIVNVSSELGSIQSKLDPNWKYSFVKSLVYPSSKAAVNFITAFGRIEYPDFRVGECALVRLEERNGEQAGHGQSPRRKRC